MSGIGYMKCSQRWRQPGSLSNTCHVITFELHSCHQQSANAITLTAREEGTIDTSMILWMDFWQYLVKYSLYSLIWCEQFALIKWVFPNNNAVLTKGPPIYCVLCTNGRQKRRVKFESQVFPLEAATMHGGHQHQQVAHHCTDVGCSWCIFYWLIRCHRLEDRRSVRLIMCSIY